MTIQANSAVFMEYKLENSQGQLIDQSGDTPFGFIQGIGQIIPGLDKAMLGKNVGESFVAEIPAAEAYGVRDDSLVQVVDKERLAGVPNLEVGMSLEATDSEGGVTILTVQSISDEGVTLDSNHPLAGQDLVFHVKIVEIREATEEELSHGHIHSGDCQHG